MYLVGIDEQGRITLRLEDARGFNMSMAMTVEETQRLIRLLEANVATLAKEQA